MSDLMFQGDAPAFPTIKEIREVEGKNDGVDGADFTVIGGLTKRELFAAMAMQNLQNVYLRRSGQDELRCVMRALGTENPLQAIARRAVDQADAILAELAKKEGG